MAAFIPALPLRAALCHALSKTRSLSTALTTSPHHAGKAAYKRRQAAQMIRGFPTDDGTGRDAQNARPGSSWDHLVDFPCVFTFKVIGLSQGDFTNDIIDSVATALDMDRKFLRTSFRDRGKYRSITVEAPVNTSDQIYEVYAAIGRDPRVKFKF